LFSFFWIMQLTDKLEPKIGDFGLAKLIYGKSLGDDRNRWPIPWMVCICNL